MSDDFFPPTGPDNVTQLPTRADVDFDLDTVERPREEQVEHPFRTNVNGTVITMLDPSDLDWQDLLSIDTPSGFLQYAINTEDRTYLRKQKIPGWKFNLLMEAYMAHYRMEERMEEARRQADRKTIV